MSIFQRLKNWWNYEAEIDVVRGSSIVPVCAGIRFPMFTIRPVFRYRKTRFRRRQISWGIRIIGVWGDGEGLASRYFDSCTPLMVENDPEAFLKMIPNYPGKY